MIEKQYGGSTKRDIKELKKIRTERSNQPEVLKSKKDNQTMMLNDDIDKEKIFLAGQILTKVKTYAKTIIKKNVSLLEIANKIEEKIIELGGKPAFPVNLSINHISAHYTPSYDDKTLAYGLLKVDLGVHIDGWTADAAFSLDLEGSEENNKIIIASEKALEKAIETIKRYRPLCEIGAEVEKIINSFGFVPIVNLSGHSMKQYSLHAGIVIPNIDNKDKRILEQGIYAIEPFATNGSGRVKEGKPSGIYELLSNKSVRNNLAREILLYINKEFKTLPFCSRWIVKKFGTRALFGLKQLEENGNLYHYNQLVEVEGSKVSQTEDTIFIDERGDVILVTS